jgi:hypothetical protein
VNATLLCGACAVTAHAPFWCISCLLQLRHRLQRGLSSGLLCSSFVRRASCYARHTLYMVVQVRLLHMHRSWSKAVYYSSIVYFSAASRLGRSNVQQCHASSVLPCSAHSTLCCCACAVTAHTPLLIISCLLQLRHLLQRGFSSRPLCSSLVLRAFCHARRTLLYCVVRVQLLYIHRSCS